MSERNSFHDTVLLVFVLFMMDCSIACIDHDDAWDCTNGQSIWDVGRPDQLRMLVLSHASLRLYLFEPLFYPDLCYVYASLRFY